jgi:hypothetical protein
MGSLEESSKITRVQEHIPKFYNSLFSIFKGLLSSLSFKTMTKISLSFAVSCYIGRELEHLHKRNLFRYIYFPIPNSPGC